MPRIVSLLALLAIVVLIGVLFFQVIATFVLPLFLALILVVIFRPMYRWFVVKCKGRDRIAAVVTTLVVALIVLAPTLGFLTFAGIEAASVIGGMDDNRVHDTLDRIRNQWKLNLPEALQEVESHAALLEEAPVTTKQVEAVKEAASALKGGLHKLMVLWKLPGAKADEARPEAASERDDELATLLTQYQTQLGDFGELHTNDAAIETARQAIEETYFTRVRPKLIDRALTGEHSRFDIWLILQANPSRAQLAELRKHGREWLSSDALGPVALTTGRKVGGLLIGMIIMLVALYYFLADGPGMAETAIRLAPLEKTYVEQLLTEFDKVSRAVVVATLLAALTQGMLAGIGYWLAGLESVFLLTMLTAVLAMIPFVGATSVWLPCCLWLLIVEQHPWAAALLAIYGVTVVSTVDNIIKPLVLHGQSNIHPLLALLSVLGGVKALGPIGVFVGPMAVAFLQAVLNMLQMELKAMGQQDKSGKGNLARR